MFFPGTEPTKPMSTCCTSMWPAGSAGCALAEGAAADSGAAVCGVVVWAEVELCEVPTDSSFFWQPAARISAPSIRTPSDEREKSDFTTPPCVREPGAPSQIGAPFEASDPLSQFVGQRRRLLALVVIDHLHRGALDDQPPSRGLFDAVRAIERAVAEPGHAHADTKDLADERGRPIIGAHVGENERHGAVVAVARHRRPVAGARHLEVRDVYHMVQVP